MISYFCRRALAVIPTLFGVSLVCFFLVHLTPGGPIEQTIAEWRHSGSTLLLTDDQKQQLLTYYGFDKSLWSRYWSWIEKLMRLDLGESFTYAEPVVEVLWKSLPVSLLFGSLSFICTYFISIPLGIFKALKKDSWFDNLSSYLILFFYSVPPFALGVILILCFAGGTFWNFFPIQGIVSDHYSELSRFGKFLDVSHHLFLPLLCYVAGGIASLTILLKNSLLEQLSQDYVVTARAKGLSEKKVIVRHALRNAILPLISGLGHWLPYFFAGTLLIETVFGLNGLGRLSYDSIVRRDYPVVLAIILVLSVLNIFGNLLSDVLSILVDPRIDYI